MTLDWKKYLLAFLITAAIFATAFWIAAQFDASRVADIRATEQDIAINILSLETQFDLLGGIDCEAISENPVLSSELNTLAARLSVAEENLGSTDSEVLSLKKQYSLLEIKDYLLMQRIGEKCGAKPLFILYFYSNAGDCDDCARMGDVLTYVRGAYPGLRVYSFDYHLDLAALRTLINLRRVDASLPAVVVNNRKAIYGFKNLEEMQELVPELKKLATSTSYLTN